MAPLGRHLDGCRIGFDLGAQRPQVRGGDRRRGGLQRGSRSGTPSRQADPQYHFDGINDSLQARRRAPAARRRHRRQRGRRLRQQRGARRLALPRRAAATCSTAASAGLFFELQQAWGGIPFEVVNDGEVTALAGSMSLNDNAVLGIAIGTQRRRRLRDAAGQHHHLAQRAGLRAGGLPRRRAGRRVVRRQRLRRAVLLAAGRRPPAARRGHRAARRTCRSPRSSRRCRS